MYIIFTCKLEKKVVIFQSSSRDPTNSGLSLKVSSRVCFICSDIYMCVNRFGTQKLMDIMSLWAEEECVYASEKLKK